MCLQYENTTGSPWRFQSVTLAITPQHHLRVGPPADWIRKKAARCDGDGRGFRPAAADRTVAGCRRHAADGIVGHSSSIEQAGWHAQGSSATSTQLPPMPMGRSAASSRTQLRDPDLAIGSPSSSSPSPAKKLPMPPRPLKKMYTGVGIVPAAVAPVSSRGGLAAVKLSCGGANTSNRWRRECAASIRRAARRAPLSRGAAHVHLPLTTELQPAVTVGSPDRFWLRGGIAPIASATAARPTAPPTAPLDAILPTAPPTASPTAR